LTLIICLLLLLDCGMPVVFWQVRAGRYGHKLLIYKFRTFKKLYWLGGESVSKQNQISRLGRLLRRTHLDELPQLLSVIVGDMSLIGPRPLLPINLPDRVSLRIAVRPGITGWAQINGANLLTTEEKIAMDEWYVRHASWKLEFTIAAGTIRILFSQTSRNEAAIREALREQSEKSGVTCH
jgi:lipopolysaccharide/colanic/teichoic acid biosynthesis glycosyltransferase